MRITLEPFTLADSNRLIQWINSEEELIQFAGPYFTYPLTEVQIENYLKLPNKDAFKVIQADTIEVIGHGEINQTSEVPRLARILIGRREHRGKGLGKELVLALLNKAFSICDSDRIELNVYTWNTAAIACYESVGFVLNPGKEAEVMVNGKRWQSINMAISRERFNSQ